MTKEEKKRVLRTDFLERDQATFVHIRRTGRLGWESMIPEGGSYLDILTDGAPVEDVIRQAYRMADHLRYDDMSSFAPEFAKMVKKAIMRCTGRVSE